MQGSLSFFLGFYEISSCFYTATASNTEYSILSFAFCAASTVLQRQLDRKSDFSLLPHRSRNTAMVLLHNAFCNRKSQAIAAFFPISCFIQSVESLKQMLQILLLHRRYTAVAHHQACPISVLFQVDQNFPLWFTIFTGTYPSGYATTSRSLPSSACNWCPVQSHCPVSVPVQTPPIQTAAPYSTLHHLN